MPPARTEYRPSTGVLNPVTEVAPSHGDGALAQLPRAMGDPAQHHRANSPGPRPPAT